MPAKGQRIGNLFINPGGPGAPASTQILNFATGGLPIGQAMANSFDIIAMDPRGVGMSTPSRCDTTIGNEPSEFEVTTDAGLQQQIDYSQKLGASCRALMGTLFDNMDTIAVAKDMELVRVGEFDISIPRQEDRPPRLTFQAIGDEPMSYFGQSYGTQLGAQYAQLFPSKVRAMALDGILQHTGDYASNVLIQTKALDAAIQEFFNRCEKNTTDCGAQGPQMRQLWAGVVDKAATGTLQAPGCDDTPQTGCFRNVSVQDLLGTARGLTESPGGQRRLARILALSGTGNASFSDSFAPGLLSGNVFSDSSSFSIGNVQCQDGHFVDATLAPSPLGQVQELAALTRNSTVTPGMGEFFRRTIGCTGWPAKITNPRKALDVTGTLNPVLLVHTTFDPATSPEYARGMLKEIQGSVLLVRDGLGHTSYFNAGATAAAMDAYLVNLTMPAVGTVLAS
jgi:pimeloyl-ACP methyl ester carboxylesterase